MNDIARQRVSLWGKVLPGSRWARGIGYNYMRRLAIGTPNIKFFLSCANFHMRLGTNRAFLPLNGDMVGFGDFLPSFFPHPLETPASSDLRHFADSVLLFVAQSPGRSDFPLEVLPRSWCHIPFVLDANLPRVDK